MLRTYRTDFCPDVVGGDALVIVEPHIRLDVLSSRKLATSLRFIDVPTAI
jgi:hypothetical protein